MLVISRSQWAGTRAELDDAVVQYRAARAVHARTVGQPAPLAHPVVMRIVLRGVADYVLQAGPTPRTPEEAFELQRQQQVNEIRREAVARISAHLPAVDSLEMAQLLAVLWPHLQAPDSSPELVAARDIAQHARSRIAQTRAATAADLGAYDPATDPGWPG